MGFQYGGYKGGPGAAPSNSLLSPNIWAEIDAKSQIPGATYGHFDDFIVSYDTGTITTVANIGAYEMFAESGGSITADVATLGGAVNLISGTTGDADVVMCLGGGAPFAIGDSDATKKKLCFEARFKISSITDADQVQFFVGLTEEDRSAATGIFGGSGGATPDAAFSDIDFIGFYRLDDDGDALAFGYGKNGGTKYEVIASAHTLVANTYVSAGFVFDPSKDASEWIKVYINNVEHATKVGSSSTNPGVASTDFPDAEELTMCMGVCSDTTTSNTLTVDWWRCEQER